MASLRSQGQNDPHCADGETGEALRDTWLVQGHITDEKEDPSLKPAVSSELGPWLHPGLPTVVGWAVLVSLYLALAWGGGEQSAAQRCPWGALCKEEAWVKGP